MGTDIAAAALATNKIPHYTFPPCKACKERTPVTSRRTTLTRRGYKTNGFMGRASKSALSWKREYPASATSFPDDPACITMLLTNTRQDRGKHRCRGKSRALLSVIMYCVRLFEL